MKKEIEEILNKKQISAKYLLNNFSLGNSKLCKDPYYYPFYFFLGRMVFPQNLLEVGVGSGLNSGMFLLGNKSKNHSPNKFVAIGEDSSITRKNIKKVYKGDFEIKSSIDDIKWDLALINYNDNYDKTLFLLETLYETSTMIVLDKVFYEKSVKLAFNNFVDIHKPEHYVINTTFGSAIILNKN